MASQLFHDKKSNFVNIMEYQGAISEFLLFVYGWIAYNVQKDMI
jgi:hypothetical protein